VPRLLGCSALVSVTATKQHNLFCLLLALLINDECQAYCDVINVINTTYRYVTKIYQYLQCLLVKQFAGIFTATTAEAQFQFGNENL